jgi:toxin HigB-1
LPGCPDALKGSGMINSFGDRATEDLYHERPTARARRFPPEVVRRALKQLDVLNAAHSLNDLRVPPGNRLEALRGDLTGFHSIRVNDQWRIIFRWADAAATEVRLVDYH